MTGLIAQIHVEASASVTKADGTPRLADETAALNEGETP